MAFIFCFTITFILSVIIIIIIISSLKVFQSANAEGL